MSHRTVIFAIAQLSCFIFHLDYSQKASAAIRHTHLARMDESADGLTRLIRHLGLDAAKHVCYAPAPLKLRPYGTL